MKRPQRVRSGGEASEFQRSKTPVGGDVYYLCPRAVSNGTGRRVGHAAGHMLSASLDRHCPGRRRGLD